MTSDPDSELSYTHPPGKHTLFHHRGLMFFSLTAKQSIVTCIFNSKGKRQHGSERNANHCPFPNLQ